MNLLLSGLLVEAVRSMFVKTGRYNQYTLDMFTFDEETGIAISMDYDLPTDEYEYVLVYARCGFLRKAQTLVNNIVGYTTLRRWSYGQYTSEGRLPQQGLATGERIQLLFAGICGRDAAGDIEIDNGC